MSGIAQKVGQSLHHVKTKLGEIANPANLAHAALSKLGGIFGSLQGQMMALFSVGAVAFGLEKLITDAMDFTTNVQKMAVALNGDAVAGSEWLAVADQFGIAVPMLSRSIISFSKEMNNGTGALKQMGIDAHKADGSLRSINSVMQESIAWFHAHANASNEAALAAELFGRDSASLLPMLEQGSASFQTITEGARKFGLILSNETLERQLAFTYQIKEGEYAVRALGLNIGMALMPAVAALAQGLSNFVATHLQAFINGINRAVSYIIGIGEAFGLWDASASAAAQTLGDVTTATDNYGAATGGAAGGAHNLAEAIRGIRDTAKDATDAIDAQIAAITGMQNQANFEAKQTALKTTESEKQKHIDELKQQYQLALYLGLYDQAVRIEEAISMDKRDITKAELEYQKNINDKETKSKIDALQTQKKGIQDAAQNQIEAVQNAANAGVAAMRGAGASIVAGADKTSKDLAEKYVFAMDGAGKVAGMKFANGLKDAILGPEYTNDQGMKERVGADWGKLASQLGRIIGMAIWDGITYEMSNPRGWADYQNRLIYMLSGGTKGSNASAPKGPYIDSHGTPHGFATGGMVGGAYGAPQLILAHGGERVQTPAQQRQQGPSSSDSGLLAIIADHLAAIRYESSGAVNGQMAVQQTGG